MNATPSRWGVLCDITFAAVAASLIAVVGLVIIGRAARGLELIGWVAAASCIPILVTVTASIVLRGARARVIEWLASLPFPVQNVNALLAGVGDTIEVFFEPLPPGSSLPARSELQPLLEAVSEDTLMLRERPDERVIDIRLGVIDSKRNPLYTNHQRWERFGQILSRVLIPLSGSLPIEKVRVQ